MGSTESMEGGGVLQVFVPRLPPCRMALHWLLPQLTVMLLSLSLGLRGEGHGTLTNSMLSLVVALPSPWGFCAQPLRQHLSDLLLRKNLLFPNKVMAN